MVRRHSRVAARMRAIAAIFNVFFAAAIHAVLVRFSEDPGILKDFTWMAGCGETLSH